MVEIKSRIIKTGSITMNLIAVKAPPVIAVSIAPKSIKPIATISLLIVPIAVEAFAIVAIYVEPFIISIGSIHMDTIAVKTMFVVSQPRIAFGVVEASRVFMDSTFVKTFTV